MANLKYGKYKSSRVFLDQSDKNTEWNFDSNQSYLEIGIKGTLQDPKIENQIKVIT